MKRIDELSLYKKKIKGSLEYTLKPTDFVIQTRSKYEYFDLLGILVWIQSVYREKEVNKLKLEMANGDDLYKLAKEFIVKFKNLKREKERG